LRWRKWIEPLLVQPISSCGLNLLLNCCAPHAFSCVTRAIQSNQLRTHAFFLAWHANQHNATSNFLLDCVPHDSSLRVTSTNIMILQFCTQLHGTRDALRITRYKLVKSSIFLTFLVMQANSSLRQYFTKSWLKTYIFSYICLENT
jgi:hypothetical protein